MQKNTKKVAIIHGFSEGSWQSKRLRAELRKSGYAVTKTLDKADVIIAHSGGCYILPKNSVANLILLVGLPIHRTLHPAKSLKYKLKNDIKSAWWFKNLIFNSWYFLTRPSRWINIWRAWSKHELPSSDLNIVAIRNRHDSFMHPSDLIDLNSEKNWSLASLPGHHDDIWINPRPYVEIINRKLKDAR